MATSLQLQLQIILLLFILLSLFISAATSTSAPSFPPPSPSYSSSTILFTSILDNLGFQQLSTAVAAAKLSAAGTPLTVFAPSDSSILTCPSCSLPLLLREHAVPGLYPLHFLRNLAFGTKIETLAPNYCLTITTSFASTSKNGSATSVFVNGVEITSPDLFNNGFVMIHGLKGFVSHLSPLSCNIERTTTLSFPQPSASKSWPPQPQLSIVRLMLKDAILGLRFNGYSFLALAMRMKSKELCELKAMTVFALDDVSVFSGSGGGHAFLSNFWFHVVPNRRIMAAELVTLPSATVLPTLEIGQNLMVTTGGGGGLLAPMKINYVRISTLDVVHNSRVVVHGLTTPFPHIHFHDDTGLEEVEWSRKTRCGGAGGGVCDVGPPVPAGIRSRGYMDQDRDLGL